MAEPSTGFSDAGMAAAGAVLQAGVAEGRWPGLVASAGVGRAVQRRWTLGAAESWPGGHRELRPDAVFDVASLTKVLVTVPAVLLLVQAGALGLDDPAARYLPAVDPRIRLRHLLTHSAGLVPHRDFGQLRSAAELVAASAVEPLAAEPSTTVAYSDLGFVLLGGIVETVSACTLDRFADEQVFDPLGMAATYRPPPSWLPRIAATELVDGRPVHGRVHDENAAAAGGAVGHAGVFAGLADLERAIGCWLPGSPLLADGLRVAAVTDQTPALDGHRGLGWTCRGDGYDILSDGWGPGAVSHTGFTGTSMALDPGTGRWAVLLTNAVHFGRGRPEVLAARRQFHAALVDPA